jgi:hypothetical protein
MSSVMFGFIHAIHPFTNRKIFFNIQTGINMKLNGKSQGNETSMRQFYERMHVTNNEMNQHKAIHV